MKLYIFEEGVKGDDSTHIAFSIASNREEAIKNILYKHLNYNKQLVEKFYAGKEDYEFWKEYFIQERQESIEKSLNESPFLELDLNKEVTYFDGELIYKKDLKIIKQ